MPESDNNMESPPNEETLGADSTESETGQEPPGSTAPLPKPDLIKKVTALYTKHKRDRRWVHLICEELNAEGMLTVYGKRWADQNLRRFVEENAIALKPPSGKKSAAGKPTPGSKKKMQEQRKPAQEKPQRGQKTKEATPEPSPEPQKTLLLDEHYPKFRKDIKRVQKPFRLSAELLKRAQEQQSGDVPRSGESIRELIELLLWHYLDRPEEFLWMHRGEEW